MCAHFSREKTYPITTDKQDSAFVASKASTCSWPAARVDVLFARRPIDDAIIIAKIGSSKCQFDTSPDALIQLKTSGVSGAVLSAMLAAGK